MEPTLMWQIGDLLQKLGAGCLFLACLFTVMFLIGWVFGGKHSKK